MTSQSRQCRQIVKDSPRSGHYRHVVLRALIASIAMALVACGGGDGDDDVDPGAPDAGDPGSVTLRGECPMAEHIGGFEVGVLDTSSYVEGKVNDGVTPATVLSEVMTDGDCVLLDRTPLFCDPPCGANELCGASSTCVPVPRGQDVGVVSVFGLVEAVEMQPLAPGNDYFDTTLPHPAVAADSVVHLASTAGKYGELSLFGVGVEQLVAQDTAAVIAEGQPLALTWTAPAGEARGSVRLDLSIDLHGTTPTRAVCDFEDTGAGTVSAAVVDALLAAGVSGFPSATLSRRTVDKVDVDDGCVDFVVHSFTKVDVEVTGHIPCMFPGQCPDGQVCDTEAETCVPE